MRSAVPCHCRIEAVGGAFCYRPGEPHSELVDRKEGEPLAPLIVRDVDGEIIQARDTIVRKI
uniref:hypothetical protein n=1 Tax=Gluconobacter thailandicus TaxID=257438 RepID=UPI000A459855|nr:hypothetical protein [Gluconobacter thailandicus]